MRDFLAKTRNYLTEPDVESLCQRFGLSPDVPLHQWLEDAIYHYFCDEAVEASDPSIGERRKQLTQAADHAEALRTILAELSDEDEGKLQSLFSRLPITAHGKWAPNTPDGQGTRNLMDWDLALANLSAVLRTMADDLPQPSRTGRPAKHHRRAFIRHLRDSYRAAGGAGPEYTQDPDTSQYRGAVVEFIEEVCRLAGLRATNRAIGDTLKEIIKAEKSAKNG